MKEAVSMGLGIERDNDAQWFAKEIERLIEENEDDPKTVSVLKRLGIKTLDTLLDAAPEWAREHYRVFRSE